MAMTKRVVPVTNHLELQAQSNGDYIELSYRSIGATVLVMPPINVHYTAIPGVIHALQNLYNERVGVDTTDFNQHTDINLRPGSN